MAAPDSAFLCYGDLLHYFDAGAKPAAGLRVGGEYELFGVEAGSGKAVPFDGARGIRRILELMLEDPKWSPLCEGDQLICLIGQDQSNITIEPGAQIELSGAPQPNLQTVAAELARYVGQLRSVTPDWGVDFIGIGMHPVSRTEEIPFVDKCRYAIMAPYLKEKGALSQAMMKATATVQVNLDYTDEADAMDKLRTAIGITTLVSAIFAHSPLSGGRPNGFLTRREHVWYHTDPDRCGLLPFVFDEGASFEDYLGYALQVPMMFVVRDGCWIAMDGIPFAHFLAHGHAGLRATREDWDLHQSTLFPEVRLKQYLEVRGADAQPPHLVLSVPALWSGILYDDGARRAAWALVRDWRFEERLTLHRDICRGGLQARVRGKPILGLARELIRIASEGLRRQGEETALLAPIEALILKEGKTPAEILLEKWDAWHHDVSRLIRYCSYSPASLRHRTISQ
jgi:glutamate--cysteine ligase